MGSAARGGGRQLALGLTALTFFAIHGSSQALIGKTGNLLWTCHAGLALVGVSLLLGWARGNAIGTIMLIVGFPLWVFSLAAGGEFFPTSLFTHVGGPIVGLIGIRRLGMPRDCWQWVVAVIGLLVVLSRLFTAPELNVNLAFATWAPLAHVFYTPTLRVLAQVAFWSMAAWPTERLLRWMLCSQK